MYIQLGFEYSSTAQDSRSPLNNLQGWVTGLCGEVLKGICCTLSIKSGEGTVFLTALDVCIQGWDSPPLSELSKPCLVWDAPFPWSPGLGSQSVHACLHSLSLLLLTLPHAAQEVVDHPYCKKPCWLLSSLSNCIPSFNSTVKFTWVILTHPPPDFFH